eukprot:363926-Chlamydomonas_euryale.AAC.13
MQQLTPVERACMPDATGSRLPLPARRRYGPCGSGIAAGAHLLKQLRRALKSTPPAAPHGLSVASGDAAGIWQLHARDRRQSCAGRIRTTVADRAPNWSVRRSACMARGAFIPPGHTLLAP